MLQLHLTKIQQSFKLCIVSSPRPRRAMLSLMFALCSCCFGRLMCALLMRFTSRKVVLVADIEKAFLQVGLLERQGCYKIYMVERFHKCRYN